MRRAWATRESRACALGEHLRALVDPNDVAAVAPHEREGDEARAGCDIEHAQPGLRADRSHEQPPPARVLAEAQHGAHVVVTAREIGEELERVALALGRRCVGLRWHDRALSLGCAGHFGGRLTRAAAADASTRNALARLGLTARLR